MINMWYRRIIFKNESIFNERHQINNILCSTVVMYCVGLPLLRPDVNPVTDMYNWYLSTFERQLEVVSNIITLLRFTTICMSTCYDIRIV